MSDISIDFPLWAVVGILLVYALPATTLAMTGLAAAWFLAGRRGAARCSVAVKLGVLAVGPLWLGGLGFGGWMLGHQLEDEAYRERHYFTLDKTRLIDGVEVPGGTAVGLDADGALQTIELAEGKTVSVGGATWRGRIEFSPPARARFSARGQIGTATLAAPATLQGVPCQSGVPVSFFWDGDLMTCTLAERTLVRAAIADARVAGKAQTFACAAGSEIALQPTVPRGQLEHCTLAEPAEIGDISCAGGEEIRLYDRNLTACTLARAGSIGPVDLPAGAVVDFYNAGLSRFKLPATSGPATAFGLALPPGTAGSLCYPRQGLADLDVAGSAPVTISGVALAGHIAFDCGELLAGTLFIDTILHGELRKRGDAVSRDDLGLPPRPTSD